MERNVNIPQSAYVWADECAEWKTGGLPQLDRVLLALNDFFRRSGMAGRVPVCVGGVTECTPRTDRFTDIELVGDASRLRGDVLVISTRVVLGRDALTHAFSQAPTLENLPGLVMGRDDLDLEGGFESRLRNAERDAIDSGDGTTRGDWTYLRDRRDIGPSTARLFRSAGKPQDGFVSCWINRPLSRTLSRLVVSTPLSPNEWTLLLLSVPILGAFFLIRGDYLGFALGAICFQLHSALDGCDGELARVKYLESPFGSKLDAICDRLSTLLFCVSLGWGLSRARMITHTTSWMYFAEGLSAAVLLGVGETLLTRSDIEIGSRADRYGNYVASNQQRFNTGDQMKLWMIKRSGMLALGETATSFFGELTKRDVFNFLFMALALCGLANWVLHILAISACAILILALKEAFARALDANSVA